jgi:hypothetical protein
VNSDFKDLLRCLNAARVKYLVVGGYAVMHYSEPRYTKDLDIWIEPSVRNSRAVYRALDAFGAPLANIERSTFAEPGVLYICGLPPTRFDLLTNVSGVDFETAWANRRRASIEKVPTQFIALDDLISAKETAGRPQDKLDLKQLRRVRSSSQNRKRPARKR